jgi:hydroxymethylbilane synthase
VTRVRIGSRGSMLALAQSNWVKEQLTQRYADLEVDLTIIKTSGDQFVDRPIAAIGGKGVFTKEIEEALLGNAIDIAVHSMKDLPTELPAGLVIAAVPAREDARDVLVSQSRQGLKGLARGACLATGSLRRQAQLLHYRADLSLVAIRGNIDTRLRKLAAGEADGLVMAAAGLKRIGRDESITEFLPDEICVSAVAQGALGIEARDDGAMARLLAFLHDDCTSAEVAAERALLKRLGGGCHVPLGARARVAGDQLKMVAVVARPNGKSLIRGEISGNVGNAADLGRRLGEQLMRDGADKILASS